MTKFYTVAALDADDCETSVNSELTLREARAVALQFLTDNELAEAGAVRVVITCEKTGDVIEDAYIGVE